MEGTDNNDTTLVLSCQSWVCHGYVGNKCAVFGLQTLGVEVDSISTVQFSNHTGYPVFKGQIMNGDQLEEIMEGLKQNKLDKYSHLLTGYINSPSTLRSIMKIVHHLKSINPNLSYFCDPVMGDEGKLYVSSDLIAIYKEEVIPFADFLFPNQMEAEMLTGIKIESFDNVKQVIDKLHQMGVSNVIITSSFFEKNDQILIVGSSKLRGSQEKAKQFTIRVPKYDRYFTGTGDLLASLVLGWHSILSKDHPNAVSLSCEKSINSLHAVLKRTMNLNSSELKLIQSRKDIETPPALFFAQEI
eukprot:TRINITY_DN8489_c0_g1_i1.p1 TRINITY_DN8489_c0_g1~~TRINITY_DN8489_c0_g1_i1.p1  ORF type:complete len:300 (+),score=75.90 TRINITY_DN8489_c0_g1_i1:54-953(+)